MGDELFALAAFARRPFLLGRVYRGGGGDCDGDRLSLFAESRTFQPEIR